MRQATDTAAFWTTQAERHEARATQDPARRDHWLKRADQARACAATYATV